MYAFIIVLDKKKRVRFNIDNEPAESHSIEPQQKSGQPSTDSENNNTSECNYVC